MNCVGCGKPIEPYYSGQPLCCSRCWQRLRREQKRAYYDKANSIHSRADDWLRTVLT